MRPQSLSASSTSVQIRSSSTSTSTYLQPEVRPDSVAERRAWEEILSGSYALAVIDGVTDALGVFGLSTNDNDDVARWIRERAEVDRG